MNTRKNFELILLATIAVLGGIIVSEYTRINKYPELELIHQVDSLKQELLTARRHRDTITKIIDSSKVKLQVIDHWYEKQSAIIESQSVTADMQFFTDYLSKTYK